MPPASRRWYDSLTCTCSIPIVFFFFQAEDGIRDLTVTGVQTCALPISFQYGAQIRAYTANLATTASVRLSSDAALNSTVDRKSTRLNSSHSQISYAVFCLKKKKKERSHKDKDERPTISASNSSTISHAQ